MEAYAQALNFAIPLFSLLIGIEMLYGYLTNNVTANLADSISSISSGITNITKDILGLVVAIISYTFLYENFAFFDFEITWWMFPLVFLVKDFSGYWIHRLEHMVNYFWNRHMVHHSSEEYNLACALRQSISEVFSFAIFLLFPLALLGVPPEVFAIVAPVHLFAQFWYHTRHIDKMGFLEKVIVTPSHHRVHHAINDEYLDKNFSQIFIFWDKLFGTFQPELEDVPPVYGVKKAVATWNPILINFQHAYRVWIDFFRTKSWKDKARIWFMPTGWRPEDVAEKFPITYTKDAYTQVKYKPFVPTWVNVWSFFQLLFTLATALFMFNHIAKLGFGVSLIIGAFIFLTVFSYTSIMDGKKYGAVLEIFKVAFIGSGIYFLSNSFEWNSIANYFFVAMIIYSIICLVLAIVFLASKDRAVDTVSR